MSVVCLCKSVHVCAWVCVEVCTELFMSLYVCVCVHQGICFCAHLHKCVLLSQVSECVGLCKWVKAGVERVEGCQAPLALSAQDIWFPEAPLYPPSSCQNSHLRNRLQALSLSALTSFLIHLMLLGKTQNLKCWNES